MAVAPGKDTIGIHVSSNSSSRLSDSSLRMWQLQPWQQVLPQQHSRLLPCCLLGRQMGS